MLVAPRLRQTSSVGGASDTEHTAVAVKPVLPLGPVGGDDMDGGAEPAHRLAERPALDALGFGDRREGAGHVGVLVDPAHDDQCSGFRRWERAHRAAARYAELPGS